MFSWPSFSYLFLVPRNTRDITFVPEAKNSSQLTNSLPKGLDSNSYTIWALVAHTCTPSNSGWRDQENHSPKSAWANSIKILSQRYSTQKWAGRGAQVVKHLCNNCGALIQTPVLPKNKKVPHTSI
jgi:hypothetical protein